MEYIVIGEILKAQGIKGEIKVSCITDDPSRFKSLRLIYIDEKPYKIMSLRVDAPFAYLKLQGVDDRNTAELLQKKLIKIDRVNAVELPENSYFIVDIIGCKLTDENNNFLGEITAVDKFGSADVITVRSENSIFRFPFLNRLVKNINIQEKTFSIFKTLLDEVCVYEN